MVKQKDPLKELESKLTKLNVSENPSPKKTFDFDRFVKLAREVKQTFSDEDLIRLRPDIQAR